MFKQPFQEQVMITGKDLKSYRQMERGVKKRGKREREAQKCVSETEKKNTGLASADCREKERDMKEGV